MHAIIRSTVFTVAGGVVACSSNASTPGAGGAGAAVAVGIFLCLLAFSFVFFRYGNREEGL